MSLSGALSNALSGLNANSRGTTVVSSNIANALNETYGRRAVLLGTDATQTSGGVKVVGVTRFSDPVLAQQKRFAAADLGQSGVTARFATDLEAVFGGLDTLGSVAANLTRLETALLSAASDPSSDLRLRTISVEADTLAASFRSASDGIQQARMRADSEIADMVRTLDTGLQRIESLNARIVTAKHLGQDVLGLLDQRDAQLEAISGIVPLHVIDRDTGAVALFTKSGKSLLDGTAAEIGFQRHAQIEPHMRLDNGLLSPLTVNGDPVTADETGPFAGGSLSALFDVRDRLAVDAQSRLDGLARDLVERFETGGPDASILPGDTGLFTDNGAGFLPANEVGLSKRLSLNSALQPASAELWRWRDGLNAASPGDTGSSSLLLALHARLSEKTVPNSAALAGDQASFVDHVQTFTNDIASDRVRRQDRQSFAEDRFSVIRERAASNGVDTDQELQKLIALEKSYAANARVVRVVDDMLDELLGI